MPERKSKLRLFVWTDFAPDYKGGLAFAMARDETDARKQILEHLSYDPMDWGKLEIHSPYRRVAKAVTGGS